MVKPVSEQKLLWYLTALENLESILEKGLLARNRIQSFVVDVADQDIIEKRKELHLDDYVPFHFFQGNPFDGSTIKYHTDKKFCFIAISRDLAKRNGYKILSKHPLAPEALIYDYDVGMKKIDWDLIDKRDYSDQECKLVCMAECLAFERVDPDDFFRIFVKTNEDKRRQTICSVFF